MSTWNFISNHAMVLFLINKHNTVTARQLAEELDITERSVRRIIKDLQFEGYLFIQKEGRSNRYLVMHNMPLRRKGLSSSTVGELLEVLTARDDTYTILPPE